MTARVAAGSRRTGTSQGRRHGRSVERCDNTDHEDEADHREDENRTGTPRAAGVREIHRRKIQYVGVVGTQVCVALVERRVDGIGEQECPRKLELVSVDEHLDVCGQGIWAVAQAPQLDGDPFGSQSC